MFDFLKKKIGGFINKLTKKEEEAEKAPPEKPPEKKKEKPPVEPKEEVKPIPKEVEKKPPEKVPEKKPPEKKVKKPEARPPEPKKEKKEEKKIEKPPEARAPPKAEKPKEKKIEIPKAPPKVEKPKAKAPPKKEAKEPPKAKPAAPKKEKPVPEKKPEPQPEEVEPEPVEPPKEEVKVPEPEKAPEEEVRPPPKEEPEPAPEEKPKERMKLGAISAIRSFITRQVEIKESDVGELLENLELELLEADVEITVAEEIKNELEQRLVGQKVKKDELHSFISATIKETLIGMITNEDAFDLVERVKGSEKPVSIMFLGINGAGKTTTIGKVAKLLMNNDQKVVFAAADTFRAAAIEQMEVHAGRLDVKMIKRDYGSDPTSVAYDAVNYAKAHGIDAVLIDTAGRQDTNISLINEMKKMTRVIKPTLKVYIGESIAGNAIIEQVASFNKEIGIDAVILTKMDCDPKGGTMLSINRATGIPIIYVGMGQAYEDLEAFDPQKIVDRIVE